MEAKQVFRGKMEIKRSRPKNRIHSSVFNLYRRNDSDMLYLRKHPFGTRSEQPGPPYMKEVDTEIRKNVYVPNLSTPRGYPFRVFFIVANEAKRPEVGKPFTSNDFEKEKWFGPFKRQKDAGIFAKNQEWKIGTSHHIFYAKVVPLLQDVVFSDERPYRTRTGSF